jgi:hypothetical protein
MSDKLVIYHAGVTGEFIGSGYADPDPMDPGNWLIPARAYREQPPEPGANQSVIRGSTGWELVADYRGLIYGVENGLAIQYDELGELPYGFTAQPCPGADYIWLDGQWLLDEAAQDRREQSAARAWRDSEIDSVKWLRERHRDESELGVPHVLTDEQFRQLLTYMQALRDWPATADFPNTEKRPIAPAWIADQSE